MQVIPPPRLLLLSVVLVAVQGLNARVYADPLPAYTIQDLGDANLVNGQFVDRLMIGNDYLARFDASGNVTRYVDRFSTLPDSSNPGNAINYTETYFSRNNSTGATWPDQQTQMSSAYVTIDGQRTFIGHDLSPFGVNQQGTVVGATGQPTGFSTPGFSPQAFVYTASQGLQTLGTLGGASSYAYAISDSNQIVGSSEIASVSSNGLPNRAAFLMVDGVMTNLNTLIPLPSGWNLLSASDINSKGQILGEGINPSGRTDYFLLTPLNTPEPTALFGFAIPFAYAAMRCRRRLAPKN
ncbi:hypothetical protein [Singulisphaera sp. PoT]|uniref:hypothetical protein n=1 Tax=Singulisphaera sp. PoT TaxID=3411797 RepID=UPI003BF4BEA2